MRRSKYPWSTWTNGQEHTIYQGADYTISTYNMQISLHGRAKVQGLTVTTKTLTGRALDENGMMQTVDGLRFRFHG